MVHERRHLNWLGASGLFIIGILVLATVATAEDILPISEEVLAPVSDTAIEKKSGAPETLGELPVHGLPPVDVHTYQALKARAQTTAASPAEAVRESPSGPQPLVAAVTTSILGLDQANAGNASHSDANVGKSTFRVLEAVNVSLRLFTAVGGVLATKTLNTFFGAAAIQGPFHEPKVYYDRNAVNRRFYVVARQNSGTTDATGISLLWLAVSRSSDPANLEPANWCRYAINGKRNPGTAISSWADYPGLGVGADKLVISANQVRFTNRSFTVAIVRVLNKLRASDNATSCPALSVFVFQPSGVLADGRAFTLRPAQQYTSPSSFVGTSNPVYLVNSILGNSNAYRVWRVRNFPPTLQGATTVAGNFVNSIPPNAPQQGSAALLDTGDTRVTQVAGRGNLISAVHGTGCVVGPAGSPTVSCVRHMRFLVGQNAAGALTATINDQVAFGFPPVAGTGTFIFWPGIAVNNVGQTAIGYYRNRNTAGTRFLSSFVTLRTGVANSAPFPIASGTCAKPTTSSGAAIGAQTDPSDFSSFWLAGERATLVTGTCKWQTRIIKLQLAFVRESIEQAGWGHVLPSAGSSREEAVTVS